mmetsp:Transcript_39694/g.112620  ORF Transcript_39694/g.112620 Transcript_39694/m.112620 type:complete len:245 (-) Transcript_39694:1089-1823(-)
MDDWHSGQGRGGVLHSGTVYSIIGAHHQAHIETGHLVVNLLHLQHDVVRDTGLGEKHVELPGHTSSNRVNCKDNLDAAGSQGLHELSQGVLALGNCQAVAGDDHHRLGAHEGGGNRGHIGCRDLASDLHGGAGSDGTVGGHLADKDTDNGPVHGLTHDVGEDGTTGANEGAHNDEEVIAEDEALRAEGPARHGVEECDHHRHVRAAHTADHVEAKKSGDSSGSVQRGGGSVHVAAVVEGSCSHN